MVVIIKITLDCKKENGRHPFDWLGFKTIQKQGNAESHRRSNHNVKTYQWRIVGISYGRFGTSFITCLMKGPNSVFL